MPLLSKPDGTIIDGFRRYSAAKLDGKPERLDVIISDEPLTPAQVKEIQLVTALHRADLTPYEQFVGCTDWLSLNPQATAKDLAARIDRDPSTLVRVLSLSKCIKPVQQAAAEGKLGPSEWYAISKVPEAEQTAMLAARLAGASRDQLEELGRKLCNSKASGIRVDRLKVPIGPQGRSVTIAGKNLGGEDRKGNTSGSKGDPPAVSPLKRRIADSKLGLYGTNTQGEAAEARGAIAFMLPAKGESHGTLSFTFRSVRASPALVG